MTFSDAIVDGSSAVESLSARRFDPGTFTDQGWPGDCIPLFPDVPEDLKKIQPLSLVDARMLKRGLRDYRDWANLVIGLGPGFTAGSDCHAVIETMRGHGLGRIIWKGSALPDTGIPGNIGGETKRRVIHAPGEGTLTWLVSIGDLVEAGDTIGTVNETLPIHAPLRGMVRGLINPLVPAENGLKIADIDPRGNQVDYHRVSDKSNAVGRAVLETILTFLNRKQSGLPFAEEH